MEENIINEYSENEPNLFRKSNVKLPDNMNSKKPITEDEYQKILSILKHIDRKRQKKNNNTK